MVDKLIRTLICGVLIAIALVAALLFLYLQMIGFAL